MCIMCEKEARVKDLEETKLALEHFGLSDTSHYHNVVDKLTKLRGEIETVWDKLKLGVDVIFNPVILPDQANKN